ncbi:hypothetical protein [Streptomyces sp. NPDC002994]|uniref:hypothetical protein n=1 Tax=Streptomyces sp. NPDC002994 TaxID=3154441 RepID=UPI0033A689D5
MTPKRFTARLAAMALATAFIAAISIGAYYDVGGWAGVAAVWGTVAVLFGTVRALIWALDNWNAR